MTITTVVQLFLIEKIQRLSLKPCEWYLSRECSPNIKQVKRKQAEIAKYNGTNPPYGYQFNGDDKTSLIIKKNADKIVRYILMNA